VGEGPSDKGRPSVEIALKLSRLPTLSADAVSRIVRRTPETTADKIVEACGGSGWDLYRPAHQGSRVVYATRSPPTSITRGWPNTASYRACASVVSEVAKVASARGVMCHDLPGRLFSIRPDLAIGLPRSFYFVAGGHAHVFDLQPRKSNVPSVAQLSLRASIFLEAVRPHPDLGAADIELVECSPALVAGPHVGELYKRHKLDLKRGNDLVAALQVYADAWDLLRKTRSDFVDRVLNRQREKTQKPDAQLYLF